MEKNKKLPVYKGFIESEEVYNEKLGEFIKIGVTATGFVDVPATGLKMQAFKDHIPMTFKVSDKEKRIVSGWAMVADTPIYRNEDGFEYYIQFEQQDVFKLVKAFFKNDFNKSVNIMHDENMFQNDVYVIESVFQDERGIKIPESFGKVPNGSWFLTFAVDNVDTWENWIKTGKVQGFSIEGLFKQVKIGSEKAQVLEKAHDRIAKMRSMIAEMLQK